MNLGPLLVLAKLFGGLGLTQTIGPPAPDVPPSEVRPTCGPGKYAYKDPLTGLWTCLTIPKGR
jgi:hypothetical protein